MSKPKSGVVVQILDQLHFIEFHFSVTFLRLLISFEDISRHENPKPIPPSKCMEGATCAKALTRVNTVEVIETIEERRCDTRRILLTCSGG